jgi:hypothetical protein
MGKGQFGAPRGERTHRGIDLAYQPWGKPQEQSVVAPCNCIFVRESRPYTDGKYRGVLLKTNDIQIKMFYFAPLETLDKHAVIIKGQLLGYGQDISEKYGSDMVPHLHMEVAFLPFTLLNHKGEWNTGLVYVDPQLLMGQEWVSSGEGPK